jgi:hypothetical protein
MTARALWTLVVLAVLAGVVVAGYLTSRRRSRGVIPGEPDRVSADVVSGLMAELRKSQAESAYWKSTAERLQREADEH